MKLFKSLEAEVYKHTNAEVRMKAKKFAHENRAWLKPFGGFSLAMIMIVGSIYLVESGEISGKDYERLGKYVESYKDSIPGLEARLKEMASDGKVIMRERDEIFDIISDYNDAKEAVKNAARKEALLKQVGE